MDFFHIYILFVLYTTHAEAVGAIVVVQRVDAARVKAEVSRVTAVYVVQKRGPIEAVYVRVG